MKLLPSLVLKWRYIRALVINYSFFSDVAKTREISLTMRAEVLQNKHTCKHLVPKMRVVL